ncbi:hypothetical protein ABK040_013902 [Willaertia magna]
MKRKQSKQSKQSSSKSYLDKSTYSKSNKKHKQSSNNSSSNQSSSQTSYQVNDQTNSDTDICKYWNNLINEKSQIIFKEMYRYNWNVNDLSVAKYTTSILSCTPILNWYELCQARYNIRIYSNMQH